MPPKPQDKGGLQLSKGDQSAFKTLVEHYDHKRYKKAVKVADGILKNSPEHPATIAMKGLAYGSMDKKEDGYALVRDSIRLSMTHGGGSTCWHALGLLYRSDTNNVEAMKSYKMALRQDPTNPQLLRDLGILQMHLRDYKGLQVTRRELLGARSNIPAHWVGFAVSHHMTNNYTMALEILRAFENTLPADRKPDIESNGLKFYCVQLLEESGNVEGALELLDRDARWFINQSEWSIKRASLLTKLGRFEEATGLWREHLTINPENYIFHRGLQCCLLRTPELMSLSGCNLPSSELDLSPEQVAALSELYSELAAAQPKCRAHKRIPLSFLPGTTGNDGAFTAALNSYLTDALRGGLISVFNELKPLYRQPGKSVVIERLVLSYLESLKGTRTLPSSPDVPEFPTTLLWTLYFAARHFDLLRDHVRALGLIEEAIAHTPTLLDLYMFKARVLKHLGRIAAAADVMNSARTLDLADRYVNSKSTKYKLRANRVEDGKSTIALFARDTADAMANIRDVQTVWFELELGDAYLRLGNLGMALRNYLNVIKHFDDYYEGQYDYHGYCIRKFTLSSYNSFIKFLDGVYSNPSFVRAVSGAVCAYMTLQQLREDAEAKKKAEAEAGEGGDGESKLSAADKKKLKQLKRKEKKEEAKKSGGDAVAVAGGGAGGNGPTVIVNEEAEATKLTDVESPLTEAHKFAQRLLVSGSKSTASFKHVVDLAIRRGKLVQAVKAVNTAASLTPNSARDPDVFLATVRVLRAIETALSGSDTIPAPVRALLTEFSAQKLGTSGSLSALVQSYLTSAGTSLPEVLAAAEAMSLIGNRGAGVTALLAATIQPNQLTQAVAALKLLEGWGETASVSSFKAKCVVVFPGSDAFDPTPTVTITDTV